MERLARSVVAAVRSARRGPTVWTLVKIVVIAMPLILARRLSHARRAQGHRLDAGAHRPEPRRPARPAAAVRRRVQADLQGNRHPVGREPLPVLHRADAGARPGARGVGGHPVQRHAGAVEHQRRAALRAGDDVDRRLRHHPRRLGVELQVRVPRLPALGGADRQLRDRDGLRAGRRADGGVEPQPVRHRARPGGRRGVTGTSGRCSRCSSSTSSRASPRPTATRSTSPKASPRSSPASTSSTRASRSRCSSSPST